MKFIRTLLTSFFLIFGTAGFGQSNDLVLPMGQVFDQGGTNWCWAYSSFHTLRTFFSANPDPSGAWEDALADLESPRKIRSFLSSRFPRGEKHYPYFFVETMAQEYGLDASQWLAYFRNPRCRVRVAPGGEAGITIENTEVPGVIKSSLERGAPIVFCNGIHCVSIYGASFGQDGSAEKYWIADSLSARVNQRAARDIHQNFCSMMTLAPAR